MYNNDKRGKEMKIIFILACAAAFLMTENILASDELNTLDQGVYFLKSNECWKRCNDCKSRCKKNKGEELKDCEENCYDINATCCEAHGQKGWYKSCGCK